MIEHSPDISSLSAALHAAQAQLSGVVKDAKNPHFKNRYATLEAVIDTARPALQSQGLAFTQAPGAIVGDAVEITTMLMHTGGQWLRSTLHVPLGKKDPQGVGSAITYGCRYALMAVLGLPPVDDDGEAAAQRPAAVRQAQAQPRPASDLPLAMSRERMLHEIQSCGSLDDLRTIQADPAFRAGYKALSDDDKTFVRNAMSQLERSAA